MNYTLIALLCCFQIHAQTIIPLEQESIYKTGDEGKNYYYKDVNGLLNKFLGNWKYEAGSDIVEIKIVKEENNKVSSYHKDEVHIQFQYKKNGVVLINTLNNNTYNYLISGGRFKKPENTNKIHLLYIEPGQTEGNRQWLDIEYIESSMGPKLHWVATYEVLTSVATPPKMPLDMTFSKQP